MKKLRTFLGSLWPPLPVWKRLDSAVIVLCAYTAGVELVFHFTSVTIPDWSGFSAVLNAIILGVLLSFRNRSAYERWWEARKLWGQLVNESRNLSLKLKTLPILSDPQRQEIGRMVVSFAIALKMHLRGGTKLQFIPGFQHDSSTPLHSPLYIARRIYETIRGWRSEGTISDFDLLLLDMHMKAFMDICGACERIKNTPMPLSYRSLLKHGLVLYLFTTPWLIVDNLGWWAVPVIGLLTYFLVGIEFTAEDVEEPFGRDGDDLALSAYCETIRKSVVEILGEGVDLSAKDIDLSHAGAL